MRLRDLTDPLYEFVLDKAVVPKWASKEPVAVHKNPSMDELVRIAGHYQTTRGFLVNDGILVWGMTIHAPVADALDIRDNKYIIPVILYVTGKYAEMVVTDYSRFTVWHENPKTADAIRSNPYVRKMFGGDVGISYYNEAEVGDWEDL